MQTRQTTRRQTVFEAPPKIPGAASGVRGRSSIFCDFFFRSFWLIGKEEPLRHVIVYARSLPGGSLQAWVSEVSECPHPLNVPPSSHDSRGIQRLHLAKYVAGEQIANDWNSETASMPKMAPSSATLKPARLSRRPSKRRSVPMAATKSSSTTCRR